MMSEQEPGGPQRSHLDVPGAAGPPLPVGRNRSMQWSRQVGTTGTFLQRAARPRVAHDVSTDRELSSLGPVGRDAGAPLPPGRYRCPSIIGDPAGAVKRAFDGCYSRTGDIPGCPAVVAGLPGKSPGAPGKNPGALRKSAGRLRKSSGVPRTVAGTPRLSGGPLRTIRCRRGKTRCSVAQPL